MTKYSNHDHYLNSETGVLINRLNIQDEPTLEKAEATFYLLRSVDLSQNPVQGNFDLAHLQAIHRCLFGDLYDWAGELRTIDISKGETRFAHHAYIETAARPIFAALAEENFLAGLEKTAFAERAAWYLGEINVLHPFREGNGRAQREFINQIAAHNGFLIDWIALSQAEMVQACIAAYQGNLSLMTSLIQTRLRMK
jgi:cell filamentation protein